MGTQTTRSSDAVEFTHSWYREFLDRIREAGYEPRRFCDPPEAGDLLLRHDVDLSLSAAVEMARIEADRGVSSTYFVLLTSALYNPLDGAQRERIRELASLGHEVALHFSTHEYWPADDPPDEADLRRRIDDERAALATVVDDPTASISFHVPPGWVLGRSFDGLTSAYAPEHFRTVDYVADSGQRWRDAPPDLSALAETAQVLTHPGLWGETDRCFSECVERSVVEACDHGERSAHEEFLDGRDDEGGR